MATVTAKAALDMNAFDFSHFHNAKKSTVNSKKTLITIDQRDGVEYKFSGKYSINYFARSLTGTATKLVADKWNHGHSVIWTATGIKLSAADVLKVAKTKKVSDDHSLIAKVFSHNDRMTGSSKDDWLKGFGGNDTLIGGNGKDRLDGGAGSHDTADYSSRSDAVTVALNGSGWVNVLLAGLAEDKLANIENIRGGSGNDVITGDSHANSLSGNNGADSLSGSGGNDTLSGGNGNDTLLGGSGNDTLSGGNHDDSLLGGSGSDNLSGGSGADWLQGDSGNDKLSGGDGNDTLDGGVGNDKLSGGNHDDSLLGGDGNDALSGDAGNDWLSGDAGKDTVLGGTGNDTLFGGAGNDKLDGGANSDTLWGGDNNDTLLGGSGNDSLSGDAGNDSLSGSTGLDTLTGGAGRDILSGGASSDHFVYLATTDSGLTSTTRDYITDFTVNSDKLDLSLIDADDTVDLDQAFVLDARSATSSLTVATGHIGWYYIDKPGTANDRTILVLNANADPAPDMTIELKGHLHLTEADFIL